MEGHCSTGQNPQWAVVPMEEEEEEEIRLLSLTPTHFLRWKKRCQLLHVTHTSLYQILNLDLGK